jgi:hypothetical protein
MMTTDPKEIAAGLTGDQKRVLKKVNDKDMFHSTDAVVVLIMSNLVVKGLLFDTFFTQMDGHSLFVITPLGLAVKAELEKEERK